MKLLRVLLLVVLVVVAACAPAAEPTEAPAVPTAAPEEAVEPTEAPAEEEAAEEEMAEEVPWEDVILGFGGSIPLSHPGVYVGEVMGFWEDEHINLEVQGNDGSTQSMQLLQAGQVDIAQIVPETLINAQNEGVEAVSPYTVNVFSSKLCTSPENAIDDIAELKGAKVGIPSPTSGLVYFTRAMLTNAGLDPDTDVEYVPTGYGPAAAESLANGDVDAVAYWAGWFIGAEELGYEFDCHLLPGMEAAPGHVLAVMQETVDSNPGLIERIGRAYAKSIEYALTHPEGTVQAYWELYPEAKATDVSEEELLASSVRQVTKALEDFVFDYAGWRHGNNNPEGWAALVQFMLDTGQIETEIPAENLINNDFVDAYNDFDPAEIKALPPEETMTAPAEPAEVPWEDVVLGFGGSIPLSHPGVYVGEVMGFWEDEHINLEVQGNDGSTQSMQLLQAGQVDIAQIVPETLINAQNEGVEAVSPYTVNVFSSKLCTSPDNAIDDIAELKGAKVGIPSPTSGLVYFTRAMLANAGLDPDTDVEYVPTGYGPAAAESLANGNVDAVAYWAGWFIGAEEMGYEFDCHLLPGMEAAPGHVLAVMQETVDSNPGLVERIGRAYAKSIEYALTHPEGTVQAYWELYPEAKATDMSEEELLASSVRQVTKALEDFVFDYAGWQHGNNNPEGWAALVQFMLDTEQIETEIPAENLINNDFVDAYNDFDSAEIEGMPDFE
ncbi:ABC transporter substrate-binding protein [Chloroflexota bacterium]